MNYPFRIQVHLKPRSIGTVGFANFRKKHGKLKKYYRLASVYNLNSIVHKISASCRTDTHTYMCVYAVPHASVRMRPRELCKSANHQLGTALTLIRSEVENSVESADPTETFILFSSNNFNALRFRFFDVTFGEKVRQAKGPWCIYSSREYPPLDADRLCNASKEDGWLAVTSV